MSDERLTIAALALVASVAGAARLAQPVANVAAAESPAGAGDSSPGAAGASGRATAARCGSPEACFARISAMQRDVRAIRADFRQVKRIALLRDPLVSTGTLEFRAPDHVRWEVVTPEPLVVEIDGGSLRAGEPGNVAKVEQEGALAVFRDLGEIFTATGNYAKRFAIQAGAGDASFVLVPRDPQIARVLSAVELTFDPANGVPRRVALREASGDRTEIDLDVREVERGAPGGRAG
ncbi:MAG TPA: outer membrane lipoprotein carrier protein LolA [Candidatus Binatia bacterium]|nr:outer membrane lipoprotein carrier protein LolA [Candidatus Binatia bacterium]